MLFIVNTRCNVCEYFQNRPSLPVAESSSAFLFPRSPPLCLVSFGTSRLRKCSRGTMNSSAAICCIYK